MKSSELRGFLTGLILGDGSIDLGVRKRSFNIKSTNKDFIDYIKDSIDSVSTFSASIRHIPEHYSCGCHHKEAWEYRIKAHPYFSKLYHYFYDDYRHRKIYAKTLSWLNPSGLANWYMSDGYVCLVGKTKGEIRSRRIDFCTDRYYKEDVELIAEYLYNKFNLNVSIIKRNNTYRIRIKKESYEDFINLISPYVIPSMKYKLYLGYENKPIWMSEEFWEKQNCLKSAFALTSNVEG